MASALPSSIVAGIGFIGRAGGAVKTLGGFKKGHHTLPDAANAATTAFLGRICGAELAAEAEEKFQRVRTGLGYKRKDVTLSVTPPNAVLAAKDFTWEIGYALEETDPARYAITYLLRDLQSADLAQTDAFAEIFSGMFSEISFALKKGASVEAVIDAIEALEAGDGLRVTYPSDCRDCTIGVDGVDAQVRCTSATIDLVFPRAGSPRELMAAFAAVRGAFAVSRVLAGLV